MLKKTKNAKQPSEQVNKFLVSKVQFTNCYTEAGMIETRPGVYTRSYEITTPDNLTASDCDVAQVRKCMFDILSYFVSQFTCQMFVRNSEIDKEGYMDEVLLIPDKEDEVNRCIKDYNDVIEENVDIGHNNYRRSVYFILSLAEDTPDRAAKIFEKIDAEVRNRFAKMYGYVAKPQTIQERLYMIRQLYNPDDGMSFKELSDYFEEQVSRKRHKPFAKQLVFPRKYEWKHRDYLKVGDKYVRMLFINSLPTAVPDSVLNDLMSVSSDSVLSIIYEPMDTALGTSTAERLVKNNTIEKVVAVRDSVEDRKMRRTTTKVEVINETEKDYFNAQANELFRQAKEKKEPVILASFVIALFAEDKDQLDRDTKMLRLSASKYASQIRVCDLMQDKAFQSMLPLADSRLNVYRTFRASQLAAIQPLDVHDLFNKTKAFHGLNGISDNLVLLDRRNYPSGIICGVEHSGKSFAMKREIANTMMTTDDEVILITKSISPYRSFTKDLGGSFLSPWSPDPFSSRDVALKELFLDAYIYYARGNMEKKLTETEKQDEIKAIEEESTVLRKELSLAEAMEIIRKRPATFSMFNSVFRDYEISESKTFETLPNRLKTVPVSSDTELLTMMMAASAYINKRFMEGKSVWVYIDCIDSLLYSNPGSDFLIGFLRDADALRDPVTMVVQDSVHVITNQDAVIEYDYLVSKVSYYKLMTQGPVERRYYTEKLNIPESLVAYITDREPGEGVIATPAANIAFNDRFDKDAPFYKRFQK